MFESEMEPIRIGIILQRQKDWRRWYTKISTYAEIGQV
jgi:hypothetical protein